MSSNKKYEGNISPDEQLEIMINGRVRLPPVTFKNIQKELNRKGGINPETKLSWKYDEVIKYLNASGKRPDIKIKRHRDKKTIEKSSKIGRGFNAGLKSNVKSDIDISFIPLARLEKTEGVFAREEDKDEIEEARSMSYADRFDIIEGIISARLGPDFRKWEKIKSFVNLF